MRNLERNKRQFYYSLYIGDSEMTDDNGNPMPKYSEAMPMKANISASYGLAETEQFGTTLEYDKVIVTDWVECPIDEQTILFIDKTPDYDDCGKPLGDYIVRRVARSLNHISYAVVKVEMS